MRVIVFSLVVSALALGGCAGSSTGVMPRAAVNALTSRKITISAKAYRVTPSDVAQWRAHVTAHGGNAMSLGTRRILGDPYAQGPITGSVFYAQYTVVGNGTAFLIRASAPNSGTYSIYAYTTTASAADSPVAMSNYTFDVTDPSAYKGIETNIFVSADVDMSNGITVVITGPNGVLDPFSPNCDSGEYNINFSPWDDATKDGGSGVFGKA